MNKPSNYDSVVPQMGIIDMPEPGPYKMTIINAQETVSKNSGNEMLVWDLDIAEGKHKGYFQNRFDKDNREEKQWQLKHYRVINEENAGRLKGDIKAVEESNSGFVYDFNDPSHAVNCDVGCNLREEEYLNSKGEIKTSLKPAYLFPLKDMAKQKPLSKKELKERQEIDAYSSAPKQKLPF